jgi:formate dehydrogenase subunit delta
LKFTHTHIEFWLEGKFMSSPDRLVYMANQIGWFFKSQGAGKSVPGIAEHIKKFWDPRMRSAILAHLEKGERIGSRRERSDHDSEKSRSAVGGRHAHKKGG